MAAQTENRNAFESSNFDWEAYLKHRPKYTKELYDLVFDYHSDKNGSLSLAHDVGAGLGNVTEVLVARGFKEVVASDSSAFHIGVAKDRLSRSLSSDVQSGRVKFEACAAEDLIADGKAQPSQADLVTVAECIPLMDAPRAIQSFSELLKPGGTLAIWFYGRPLFVASDGWAKEHAEKAQQIYLTLASRVYDEYVPFEGKPLGKAWTRIGRWLDDLELPAADWTAVKRLKWNKDSPLYFMDEKELTFITYKSKIGKNEEIVSRDSDKIWNDKVSATWLRGFADNLIPRKNKAFSEEMEKLCAELGEVMGGMEVEREVNWTATLILATRK